MPKSIPDPRAESRAAVLRSWIALERFETKTLDRPDRVAAARSRGRRRYAVDVGPREPLPWEPGHVAFGQPVSSDKVEWRHTLHLGQFDVGHGYDRVEAMFPSVDAAGDAARDLRRPTRAPAPLLALALTSDGRPVMDSLQVSSAAWSIAQTLRLGVEHPKWLVGFEDAVSDVRGAFERIVINRGGEPGPEPGPAPAPEPELASEPETEPDPAPATELASEPTPDLPDAIDEDGIAVDPLTWDHILRMLGAATKLLGLGEQLVVRPVVRSTSWVESRRIPQGSGDTLLNSFAVDDLERLAGRLEDGRPGDALARYLDAAHLAEAESTRRTDVDDDLAAVRAALSPSRLPAGRWPADPEHDLALGQQLAVNLATGPGAPSVTAVNGPPGTGKTTMLRDLIAAVVTERATVLATFKDPGELFHGETYEERSERTIRVKKVSPRVAGREILLACATNAAAQNVTLELPSIAAIDEAFRPGRSEAPPLLADFATAALRVGALTDAKDFSGDERAGGTTPQPATLDGMGGFPSARTPAANPAALEAWGLIAARLGRRSYCKDFATSVWWGPNRFAGPGAGGRSGAGVNVAPTERVEHGLGTLLSRSRKGESHAAWRTAKQQFLRAQARVDELRAEREAAADLLRPTAELESELMQAQIEADGWRVEVAEATRARAEQAKSAGALVIAHKQAKAQLAALGEAPAGHLVKRLTAAARKREAARKALDGQVEDAHRAAKSALEAIAELDRQIAESGAAGEFADDRVADAAARLEARQHAASGGDGTAGYVVPDESWEQDHVRRELRAPWCDAAWNEARTECFLAALALHEATLLANGRDAQRNLGVAIDLITGRVAGLRPEIVLAAWQTLFLLVPVVSTTFASLPTLLAGLGREDLGWLLIDEAGQAQPQQAAGAIWRCRSAVVVGDPLQLEPVSALPVSLAEAIRERYEVPRAYVSPEASVQRLADAVMPWGGHRGADELWVGVPLNVHRRCEEPIFDLVNRIAYDGRMVNATVSRRPHAALRAPTCWLDVPVSGRADGHWLPDEGDRLDGLLAHLRGERSDGSWGDPYDFRQVFAVSPYRDVARQLAERARDPRHDGMTGGTIHTIQGREADTVILVLGGNPRKASARHWAAARPNLLNVAASRARQRLYVIGDWDAWTELPYFKELATLRRVAPRVRR